MANIRTQLVSGQRRIITKVIEGQRRVSCSCCVEAECCMYPANQLGIAYTEDDLPDTIDVSGIILGVPTRIIVSRNGSFYGPINQSIFNGTPFSTYVFVATNPFDEIVWVEDTTNGVYTSPLGEDPCLVGNNFPEPSVIEDTFADTYNYTVVFNGTTLQSGTISRDSLCVWSNKDVPPAFHKGIIYNPETCKFEILDPDELTGDKTSPHNTPVGQYVQGNLGGLYDGAITTISA